MTKTSKKPFGPLYQKAIREFARKRGLKGSHMAIYAAILTFCNGETGQSRPGNNAIMEATGYSPKTLERALHRLRSEEFLLPIAYANGGRGRSCVYAFPLPAWSGQPQQKTTDKLTVERKQAENINHRQFVPKPPSICPETTVKLTDPTERTVRTEDEDAQTGEDGNPNRVPLGEHREVTPSQIIQALKEYGIETKGLSYSEVRAEIQKLGYQIVRQKD